MQKKHLNPSLWKSSLMDESESAAYKYLGVIMNKSLTYAEHIEKTLKKTSSRLTLLSKIRPNLMPYAAEITYRFMIQPLLIY